MKNSRALTYLKPECNRSILTPGITIGTDPVYEYDIFYQFKNFIVMFFRKQRQIHNPNEEFLDHKSFNSFVSIKYCE